MRKNKKLFMAIPVVVILLTTCVIAGCGNKHLEEDIQLVTQRVIDTNGKVLSIEHVTASEAAKLVRQNSLFFGDAEARLRFVTEIISEDEGYSDVEIYWVMRESTLDGDRSYAVYAVAIGPDGIRYVY